MHYLFFIPLIGGTLLVLLQLMVKGFSRLSLNLWNSGVATLTAGPPTEGLLTSLVDLLQWINLLLPWSCLSSTSSDQPSSLSRSVWVEKQPKT